MQISAFYAVSEPQNQRLIALQLNLARCYQRHALTDSQIDTITQKYLSEIFEQTVFQIDRLPRNDENVERFFSEFCEIRRRAARLNPGFNRADAALALREFRRSLTSFRRSAQEADPQLYSWYSTYDDTRPNPGALLAEYVFAVETARVVVEALYRDALGEAAAAHANFRFKQKESLDRIARITGDVSRIDAVNGMVLPDREKHETYHPAPQVAEPPERVRLIEIKIPAQPGVGAAFCIPYTAAHEMGVHLMQQYHNDAGPLSDGDEKAFSEGFIDCAVLEGLADSVQGLRQVPCLLSTEDALGAQQRFDHRTSIDAVASDRATVDWIAEVVSGRKFWLQLKEVGEVLARQNKINVDPRLWARRVALRLNVLDLDGLHRGALIRGMRNLAGFSDVETLLSSDSPAPTFRTMIRRFQRLATTSDLHLEGRELREAIAATDGFLNSP